MTRWPVPHPLPHGWPRRQHYALIKISAPKGIPAPQVRREVKTMVNNLRYSDGFPGEIRILAIRYVTDVSRVGLRYHLQRLRPALNKHEIETGRRKQLSGTRRRRKRKAKMLAAQNAVPRRRTSPWG